MRLTSYAYPWDLARLGVAETLERMAGEGIEAIDLAATYHPIDALSPRKGVRLFSDARGAVYFPASSERYARIKPSMHADKVCAAWPQAARHADRVGLELNAWTVTLFQPWIRDAYLDCARVLPSGDRSGSGVCPANLDVRDFIVTLVDDLVDQFGVSLVRLETAMPIFDFDWLRPRTLVALSLPARTLLNLCFCPACVLRAKESGVDSAYVQRIVHAAIAAELENGGNEKSAPRCAALEDAQVQAFACAFMRSSTELVRAVSARLRGRARVSVNAAANYEVLLGAAKEAELLAEFVAAADQLAIHPGNPRNDQLCAQAGALNPPREISALIPLLRAPVSSGPALEARALSYEALADQAVRLGATELSLYNYGLLRERDVPEFVASMRRKFG
jgi:hypothetical protein